MNVAHPTPVCIISEFGYKLPTSQEKALSTALSVLKSDFGRDVVLHHGCTNLADITARLFAHKAGWRVENHPAGPASGATPRQTTALRLRTEVLHPVLPYRDRDQEMILASSIIVAVEADWGGTSPLVHDAETAGWDVRHVTPTGTITVSRKPLRLSETAWLNDVDHH